MDRILVSLAPADVKKEGSGFDLPIAIAVLMASKQLEPDCGEDILLLGELDLAGTIRPVRGVLPAVSEGLSRGIGRFVVPAQNAREAEALEQGTVLPARNLRSLCHVLSGLEQSDGRSRRTLGIGTGVAAAPPTVSPSGTLQASAGASQDTGHRAAHPQGLDFRALRGQSRLVRGLEIAAAGRHNLLVVGPPGSGKTMACRMFPTILPPLARANAITVTRIHSLAGELPGGAGLIRVPPFRAPHHTASREGLIGGGRYVRPGEISLAHSGVLFLDEAPEFRAPVLQALREPSEDGTVRIVRADRNYWYPADFQLLLAANPCPCGNWGRQGRVCVCNVQRINQYWKRLGGPLLDRVDVRVKVSPASPGDVVEGCSESSETLRERVIAARRMQDARYRGERFRHNARIPPDRLGEFCALSRASLREFRRATAHVSLSSRGCAGALRLARTIADLYGCEEIEEDHILEAVQHRREVDQSLGLS
jgi:magnesium chelatase family protein